MTAQTPTTVDVYAVLLSIDTTLKHLLALAEARGKRTAAASGPAIASDADLDGTHGDPEVKAKDPRDWSGEPMKGRKFSECPPAYLELVAERLDYFTSQLGESDEDKKKRGYNLKDAARARGWSARLRAGWKPPAQSGAESNPFGGSDDQIHF